MWQVKGGLAGPPFLVQGSLRNVQLTPAILASLYHLNKTVHALA